MKSVKVLLVDDVPANQRALKRLLRRRGCEVTTADHGLQAVEQFQRNPFDVVLMDLQMPVMDGYEATARIRRSVANGGADIPIIAMSARGTETDRRECLSAGMNDCVPKPVDIDQLFETLSSICDPPTDSPATAADPSDQSSSSQTACKQTLDALASLPVFDRAGVMKRIQNDQAIFELFVETFDTQSDSLRSNIAQAFQRHDYRGAAAAAHRLRGCAANLGGQRILSCAANIERAAETEDDDVIRANLDTLPGLLAELRQSLNLDVSKASVD
ncbi:response regulator [Roseiconus nitratireducens]|uniref:Response regulator n=1 Tax=Roseiconus nitratireducens TaxID=2605748 RepID=A0A5M6D981_9BACT|nr:response regulator [Roseiconus nitratireducens]KAA5543040.1 response regulator [Roseiconus nitratireducens]